jgi:hypothetical protein
VLITKQRLPGQPVEALYILIEHLRNQKLKFFYV